MVALIEMERRRVGAAVLAAAGMALSLLWLIAPPSTLPIYDGGLTPPEPYRYLHPTAQQAKGNLPPTSASSDLIVSTGRVGTGYVATREKPPQAELLYDSLAFRVPSDIKQIAVSIHAVTPPSVSPPGRIIGNVYSISATANGRSIPLRPGHARVVLRSPSSLGSPTMENYSGGRWVRLHSYFGFFQPVWTAPVSALGDFALVVKSKKAPATNPAQSNRCRLLGITLLVIVLVSAALIVLRRGRFRST
jgi:hypothetical protein